MSGQRIRATPRRLRSVPLLVAVLLGVAVTGCDDHAAADALSAAQLQDAGEQHVAAVRRAASERYREAAARVAEARRHAADVAMQAERDIALARAEVDYEVGRKACATLQHEARSACFDDVERAWQQASRAAERIEYAWLP